MDKLQTQLLAKADNFVKLAEIFKKMDKDGNKVLSSDELLKGLKTLGIEMTAAEIKEVVKDLDTNDSGGVSMKELFVGLRGVLSPAKFMILMAVFKKLDTDGSGEIQSNDVKNGIDSPVFRKATDAETVEVLMAEFDRNKDAKITREEFINYHVIVHSMPDDLFTECMTSAWKLTEKEIENAYESSLSAEKLDIITKVFEKLDKDGSGTITVDDLKGGFDSMLSQKHGSKAATGMLMKQFDCNKDGKVTRAEFLKMYAGQEKFSTMPDKNFVMYMKASWKMTE